MLPRAYRCDKVGLVQTMSDRPSLLPELYGVGATCNRLFSELACRPSLLEAEVGQNMQPADPGDFALNHDGEYLRLVSVSIVDIL